MKQVYDFLLKEVKLKNKDTLVAGISGGPDSMALLYILIQIKKELDINIICAHVNHNMRKESEEEKVFVEEYCLNNGVIFEWTKFLNYGEDNFHNEARYRRYKYFDELINKYNASYLLTAHHGDDLMETILMRLTRGSTLRGYAGFSKIVDNDNYKILRPLIYVTKDEILTFNKEHNIKYALDISNEKEVYTRNRYRKHILPFLKKEDIRVHEKFLKFSSLVNEYNCYIDKQIKKDINKVYKDKQISITNFIKLDKIIQNRLIDYIFEEIYDDDLMLIYDNHTNLLFNLINSKKANAFIYLPNNIKAVKEYDKVIFLTLEESLDQYVIEFIDYVKLPNKKIIKKSNDIDEKSNFIIRLNSSELMLPLYVRSRLDGDKMEIKGMNGTKKIKDIFIDEKISVIKRKIWPIVVDSKGSIIWIPGIKKSKFDKEKKEKYDIILKYY